MSCLLWISAAELSSVALQGLEMFDAELPVILGGIEHYAVRPAENPCPARNARVEHPGLMIAIGDQAMAMPIDNGTGMWEAAAHTIMAIAGRDLVAVGDCQRPAGQRPGSSCSRRLSRKYPSSRGHLWALSVFAVTSMTLPCRERRRSSKSAKDLYPRIQVAVGVPENDRPAKSSPMPSCRWRQ
jgi:hypothetical protein